MKKLLLSLSLALLLVGCGKTVQICNEMPAPDEPYKEVNGTLYDGVLTFYNDSGEPINQTSVKHIPPGKKSERIKVPKGSESVSFMWMDVPVDTKEVYLFIGEDYNILFGKTYIDGCNTRITITGESRITSMK